MGWNYSRSTCLGGGGRRVATPNRVDTFAAPAHAYHVALTQAVYRKAQALHALHRAVGEWTPGDIYGVLVGARNESRLLGRSNCRKLWGRTLERFEKFLGPEAVAKLKEAHLAQTPEVLKVLPKKPPGRV